MYIHVLSKCVKRLEIRFVALTTNRHRARINGDAFDKLLVSGDGGKKLHPLFKHFRTIFLKLHGDTSLDSMVRNLIRQVYDLSGLDWAIVATVECPFIRFL